MALAGQDVPASEACAAILAGNRHLCHDDLRLDRGCQPLCLRETKPKVGQTCLLIAFEAVAGVLVYLGGRPAVAGMTAILGFHVGLMFFGWGFWIWSIPMIVGVALLLRAQLRAVTHTPRTPARQMSAVRVTL